MLKFLTGFGIALAVLAGLTRGLKAAGKGEWVSKLGSVLGFGA